MAEAPLFSVITITLNCRDLAVETSKTVWAQTGASLEHIVKDAGSKDGTVEAIRCLGVPASITIAPDKGIYDAMNQAVDLCRGRYIIFLNAGDLFESPDVLKQVAATIRDNQEPEVVYTYNYNSLSRSVMKYPARLGRFFLYRRSINHQATYVRRDCFERFGKFDLSYIVFADNEFLARLLVGQRLTAVLCPIVGVRYRDGGFTAKPENVLRKQAERRQICQKYFPPSERFFYGLLHELTLQQFRQKFLNNHPKSPLTRGYYRVANLANRVLGKL